MKYNELNSREKKAVANIYHASNWLIGGLENTCMDNDPESNEYVMAYTTLTNHNLLVEQLYNMATTEIYEDGSVCFDKSVCEKELRDINFCGKEWLLERCERRISKLENEGFCC